MTFSILVTLAFFAPIAAAVLGNVAGIARRRLMRKCVPTHTAGVGIVPWQTLRNAPRTWRRARPRLRDMTSRFAPDRMTPWRQRFLAIARELEASPAPAPRARRGVHGPAGRASSSPGRSLRGIRLGCVRAA